MADDDRLSSSLSESILTALAFSEDKLASVLVALDPKLFEEPYDDIAARIIEYRSRFGKAPGREHIDDIFDHVLGNPRDRRQQLYTRLLMGLIEQAEGLNLKYVVDRVSTFVRKQTLKTAIIEASDVLMQQQSSDDAADQIESILSKAMNHRLDEYDAGLFMDSANALSFLEDDQDDYLSMGIPALDDRRLCPVRGELIILMAPRKIGKSWWGVNLVKRANIQHWKVAYISLEMSQEKVMGRLFQSFYGIAKREESYERLEMDIDKGQLVGLELRRKRPRRNLGQRNIHEYFRNEQRTRKSALHNVLVKDFPTGSLTVRKLEAYLDQIEAQHRFVPDLLIIDYPDLMYYNPHYKDDEINRIYEELRGLGKKRNMAVATPTQGNRETEGARMGRTGQVAGTIGKIATCDVCLILARTKEEKALGLARIFAAAGRGDEDGFTVLMSQDLHTGQFVLKSVRMSESKYFDMLKDKVGELDDDDSDDRDAAE